MAVNEQTFQLLQGSPYSVRLSNHIDAVAVFFDHLPDTGDMSFDVVDALDGVLLRIHQHWISPSVSVPTSGVSCYHHNPYPGGTGIRDKNRTMKFKPANLLSKRKHRAFLIGASSAAVALVAGCSTDGSEIETSTMFPVQLTDERVQNGASLYADNCASCHGTPGVSRPTLPTAPPHDENGHTWHHPDRLLFQWTLDRPPLATAMPGFRGQLSEDEVLEILAYIKSTWPGDVQKFQAEGSAQYELQLQNSGK